MLFTSHILNGLLLILLISYQWKVQKATPYLIALILLYCVRHLTLFLLNSVTNAELLAVFLFHFDPLACLFGPLILYYFRSVLEGKLVFDKKLLLFCLPVLPLFVNLLPYFLVPFDEKVKMASGMQQHLPDSENLIFSNTLFFSIKFLNLGIPVYNACFIVFSFRFLVSKYRANLVKVKKSKMIKSMAVILMFIMAPILLLSFLRYGHSGGFFKFSIEDRLVYFNLYTFLWPLIFLFFPNLVYGLNPITSSFFQFGSFFKNRFTKREDIDAIESKNESDLELILDYLEKQKPYLKKDLSLHDISRELNIPHLRVSSCFNKQLNTSFPEFRNRMRIKHAISLFQNKAHYQMSIEGIASLCGFKNKSSFYSAFKAEYGTTPIDWIKKEGLFI